MKLKIAGFIGAALMLFGFYRFYLAAEERQYCGVIKFKVDATRYGKHAAYADPIFVVDFGSFTKDIHPTWNHYLSSKQGDRVCYTMHIPEREDYPGQAAILVFIGAVLTVVFVIYTFVE